MNQPKEFINNIIKTINLDFLQFHGQEEFEMCNSFNIPYIKTIHVTNPKNINMNYKEAFAYLLDTKGKNGSGGTGMKFNWDVITELKKIDDDVPVIMISGHANVQMAIDSLKLGAFEFMQKPFSLERLLNFVSRALENINIRSFFFASRLFLCSIPKEFFQYIRWFY